ncbi:MAG: hypothetical protein WEC84_04560 [Candidatus Andersenbacteria bacterium]
MSEKEPKRESQPESFNVISRWEFKIGDNHYDIRKVVELAKDLPLEEIPTSSLEAMKEGEYWYDTNRNRIKLRDIFDLYDQTNGDWESMIQEKPEYAKHIKQIEESNLEDDPIVLYSSSEKFRLIDGLHRLTKAWLLDQETIQAQRFEKMPEAAIISEE